MKIIGEERLREISGCPKCGGTGYGEVCVDICEIDIAACDDCGGSGNMEEYHRYLREMD